MTAGRFDVLIVGAGLYGVTMANLLAGRGKRVRIIDRRDHFAGNAHTDPGLNGILVHRYGAHIFHTSDEKVWKFVNRFAAFNRYTNQPVAVWHNEVYNLPFNMNTFVRLWPDVQTPGEARARIAEQTAAAGITGEAANLEEQALSLAGRDIYEKLIREYTEKQWGRSCRELPASIIRRLPFRFTFDNNYFSDPYQGIPAAGYTAMVEKMVDASFWEGDGSIEVLLQTDYFDYVRRGEDGLPVREEAGPYAGHFVLADGSCVEKIVFTGRIDEFFANCLGALEYRSLRFETEELPEADNYQGNAVVNYTAADVPYTRIIEHKHFAFGRRDGGIGGQAPDPAQWIPGTVITREYPQAWTEGQEAYYPVNDEANNARYAQYQALAKRQPGIFFGGRLGKYSYYNMDQVIAEAMRDTEDMLQENAG